MLVRICVTIPPHFDTRQSSRFVRSLANLLSGPNMATSFLKQSVATLHALDPPELEQLIQDGHLITCHIEELITV
jgi:hypothetical protein